MSKTYRKYQENRFHDGKAPTRKHGATSYNFRKAAKQTRLMRQTKRHINVEDLHSED